MINKTGVLVCGFISLIFLGCGHEKNNYNKTVERNGLRFESAISPIKKGDNTMEVRYTISTTDNKNVLEYKTANQEEQMRRAYYFSYQAERDFTLQIDSTTSIPCSGVIFERNYNLKKDIDLTVYFDISPATLKKDVLLSFDAQTFGMAPVKMRYKANSLN